MNDHLRKWLAKTPAPERERIAHEAQTTVGHLRQLAGGHRKASPELAERLQEASTGNLTIAGLRPDLVVLAEKILKGFSQGENESASPTMNPTVRGNAAVDQSAKNAGILSSAAQASP